MKKLETLNLANKIQNIQDILTDNPMNDSAVRNILSHKSSQFQNVSQSGSFNIV